MDNQNQNQPKKSGRPRGSLNRVKSVTTIAKSRQMASAEVKRLINLFMIKKLGKIDEIFEKLSPNAQAKFISDMAKFATPISGKEENLLGDTNQIQEIKISYDKPKQIALKQLEAIEAIEEAEEVSDDLDEDSTDYYSGGEEEE